jgi:molybdate transport system permease protein
VIDWIPFWVSAQLGLWVTAILLIVGFPLAWLFAFSRSRWVVWVESVFSLPLVLAPTVVGFYLLLLLSPQNGLGKLFQNLFGVRLAFSFPAIVFAGCVSALPSMLAGLKTGLLSLPVSLLEASATLGKGPLETFFRVVLPQMRGGVLVGIILTFAHTLGEFGVVLMIGGSLPGITKVVSIAIYERVEALDFGAAHLYSLVLIAVAYPLVVILNYLQRRESRRLI